MSLSLSIRTYPGDQDLSDYIIGLSEIPIFQINYDLSPIVFSFDMSIDSNGPQLYIGSEVKVEISNRIFIYRVIKKKFNEDQEAYQYTLNSKLEDLKGYYLNWEDTFHTSNLRTSNPYQYYVEPDIGQEYQQNAFQVIHVIEQMFLNAGVNLFISTAFKNKVRGTFNIGGSNKSISNDDFMILENQLFNVGQNVAIHPSRIENDRTLLDNRASYFEIVEKTFQLFGWVLVGSRFSSYQFELEAIDNLSFPSISDDTYYNKVDESIVAREETFSAQVKYADLDAYFSDNQVQLTKDSRSINDAESNFNWLNNLRFMVRDTTLSNGSYYGGINEQFDIQSNWASSFQNFPKQIIESNRIEYNAETDQPATYTNYRCLENKLDYEQMTNKLVWERSI